MIYRYEVPVDDRWHEHRCSTPLAVGCRRPDVVEFWAFPRDDLRRHFRVVGTGQAMPEDGMEYRGTAVTPDAALVWHLMERHPAVAAFRTADGSTDAGSA